MIAHRRFAVPVLATLLALPFADRPTHGQAFDLPPGGWAYIYNGDADANADDAALDGTWNHDNGSDSWDGTAPGTGRPGGAGVFTEGDDTFLRIQDTGDPRDFGQDDPGSNRKVYFTHDMGLDGASETFLDDGVTLSFGAGVPTTGVLDDLHVDGGAPPATPWPAEGNGLRLNDGGKSVFSLQQFAGTDNDMSIAFALAVPSDHEEAGETG
ncbi:MAG: hypothetical protein AAF961_13145, partial [Planctomycetota bacterium]